MTNVRICDNLYIYMTNYLSHQPTPEDQPQRRSLVECAKDLGAKCVSRLFAERYPTSETLHADGYPPTLTFPVESATGKDEESNAQE